MRAALLGGTVLVAGAAPALAQEPATDSLRQETAELKRRLEELELRLAEQAALLRRQSEQAMRAEEAGGRTPSVDQRQRMVSGIYGRPFVRRFGAGTAVGGYVDLELEADLDSDDVTFDQHRLIPFIFAEITDRIHFGTELEFEHGAREIKVEFAALDVSWHEWLNFRGGIVLSPLGKFNLIHDSPVNDLTERPLVSRELIPTTLSEAGVGLFGTLYPSETAVLTYEGYVVNGFDHDLAVAGDALRPSPRIRSGRGSVETDNNAAKSIVTRFGYSPFLGLELGGSLHTGVYAPKDEGLRNAFGFDGDERLTIFALDGIFSRGAAELLGEYARSSVDMPGDTDAAQQGFYVQGNYHFGYGWMPFFDNSIFTGVVRWDQVDFDVDADGDAARVLTFGLNWRPVEETVFKFDLSRRWNTARGATESGDPDRKFFFSIASYF